jgi:hypothetical protein
MGNEKRGCSPASNIFRSANHASQLTPVEIC